jgi:hypothetical protein
VILAVGIAGFAMGASGGGSKAVTICAADHGGALTLAKKGKCAKKQRKLVISKEGPRGEQGLPGAAGAAGTTASIQPEPVHLVAPFGGDEYSDCATSPGTFCNSTKMYWANSEQGFAPAGFYKDAAGEVHLQGTVKLVELNPAGGVNEERVFILPVGYRPSEFRSIGSTCGAKAVTIVVAPDGAVEVSPICALGEPLGLDGVTFRP